jgi:hypothetical protein
LGDRARWVRHRCSADKLLIAIFESRRRLPKSTHHPGMRVKIGSDSRAHAQPAGEDDDGEAENRTAQRCPPPPYMRWDQRGKPVLLSYLKLINGKRLHLSLKTDDPDIARRHMRLLVAMLLAERRLSPDSGSAKVYGPKGTSRPRLDDVDSEIRRLKALSDAEYGSEALATAKRWGRPLGIIHHLAGRKPTLSAGTYATRRMRARQRGEQTPMGTSWHHRRQGDKYFYSDNGVMHARIQLEGRVYQWSLDTRDVEVAAAIMAPVRLARERVRAAAVEMLGCELGTAAARARVRDKACRRFAEAIVRAGGPAELVMKAAPDAESLQPDRPTLGEAEKGMAVAVVASPAVRSRAERKAMTEASPNNCEERYFQLTQARPPEPRSVLEKWATDGALARTPGGRSIARQATREKTLSPKPRAVQDIKNRKAKPFMQWARGPGDKPVLQCAVYLVDGSRLCPSLNTSDTETEAPQRMRLILWHAIAEGRLPSGVKHPAWGLYGGPISQSTKRLLKRLAALPWAEYELQRKTAAAVLGLHERTVDWLTNQDKARQHDPVRRARARTIARSRTRKDGKRTPISRSWHFSAVGGMLAVHSDRHLFIIYALLTMAGFTLRWRLPVQNRAEAEALVKPAVEARARVREAARDWRECLVGSREAATALEACSNAQRLYLEALRGPGAERAEGWAEFARLVLEPPWDAGAQSKPRRAAPVRINKKCLQLMKADARRNPDRPPHPHREYANTMRRRIPGLTHREFEECWRGVLAMPDVKWGGKSGKGGRPKSSP